MKVAISVNSLVSENQDINQLTTATTLKFRLFGGRGSGGGMGNQHQVGAAPDEEVTGTPAAMVAPDHPHANAYQRLRRLSLVGSDHEQPPDIVMTPPDGEAKADVPNFKLNGNSLHAAHLPAPAVSPKMRHGSNSRINQLLGISTPTNRRRLGSGEDGSTSPTQSKSKSNLLSIFGKGGEKERERSLSGNSPKTSTGSSNNHRTSGPSLMIPTRKGRRASIDLAQSTIMATMQAAKINSHFMTSLAEESGNESGSDGRKSKTPSVMQQPRTRITKAKELLMPGLANMGRRIRRPSMLDQGPINIKPLSVDKPPPEVEGPKIPENLIYEPPAIAPVRQRSRALTIANGHAAKASMHEALRNTLTKAMVPTVFKYTDAIHVEETEKKKNKDGKKEDKKKRKSESDDHVRVFIAGTMTNWESKEMVRQDDDFCAILECYEGQVFYKFGICKSEKSKSVEWVVDRNQEVVSNNDFRHPVEANIIRIDRNDFDVFSALTVDSFSVKKEIGEEESDRERNDDLWTQKKPEFDGKDKALKSDKGPPILPPHLLQVLLNKEELDPRNIRTREDRIFLPDPTSHVMLNHLYAQSIRDNMLVLASTTRFRKKCVTIVYYKDLTDS